MKTLSKPRVIQYFERVGDVTTRVRPYALRNNGDLVGGMLCSLAYDALVESGERLATASMDGRVVEARWVVDNPWD